MEKTAPQFTDSRSSLLVAELSRYAEEWQYDARIRQLSSRTITERRYFIDKLIWYLTHHESGHCGVGELRRFLVYLANGHNSAEGRWGNTHMRRPLRPITIRSYHTQCRVFFNWMVAEGALQVSPMDRIKPPIARADQVRPLADDQIKALIAATRRSHHPRRDEAIVLFLLDTGVRASELCSIRRKDLDMEGQCCTVLGKGNKRRTIYFGRSTAKALWQYLREEVPEADEPVFRADRGTRAGEPLTRSGLLQLIQRLGRAAGVQAVRCSPHTFRHTFAVKFLREGGHLFSLQQLLGHTSLSMSQKYVALAQGDLESQHRQFSPADRLVRGAK